VGHIISIDPDAVKIVQTVVSNESVGDVSELLMK